MGMTIKDTKAHLYMQESYALGKDYRALENALDIIRKYEKIEQILKDIPYGGEATVRRIQEVVEDGN